MKINKLGWIAALTLTGMVATTTVSFAQEGDKPERPARERGQRGPGGNMEARLKRMSEQLELTDAQQKKVKALFEAQSKAYQKLREVPREERREKFGKLRESFNTKLAAILTDEQNKKFKKITAELRERRGGGREGGREGGQRGRGQRPERDSK